MAAIIFSKPVSKPIYGLGGTEVTDGKIASPIRKRTLNDPDTFEITNDAAGHMATTLPAAARVPAADLGNGHCNEPVLAMAPGYATRRIEPSRLSGAVTDALGVIIDHGAGVWSVYWHLNAFSIPVAGAYVQRGQQIGLLGSSGLGGVCHLHIEIKVNGTSIDPQPFLFGAPLVIGEDMAWHSKITRYKELRRVELVSDGWDTTYRTAPELVDATVAGKLAAGAHLSLLGWTTGDAYAGTTRWEVYLADGQGLRTFHTSRVSHEILPPQPDCTSEVNTAVAKNTQTYEVRIDRIKGALAKSVQEIAGL